MSHIMTIGLVLSGAPFAANLRPIKTRHDPIEQRETRRIFLVQFLKGAGAVFGGDYFIAGTLQSSFKKSPGKRIVFRNQYPHALIPASWASTSGRILAKSPSRIRRSSADSLSAASCADFSRAAAVCAADFIE